MKGYIVATLALLLVLPLFVYATADEVSLVRGGGEFSIDGTTITMTGTTDTSIASTTVNANSLTITLEADSSIEMTASNRKELSHDAPAANVDKESECSSSLSKLKLNGTSTLVTVTVSIGELCSTGGSGGGSSTVGASSSSGGGSSVSTSATTPSSTATNSDTVVVASTDSAGAPTINSTEAETIETTATTPNVSSKFSNLLARGAANSDVKRLQQLLNSDPDTRIASNGVGSPGQETNYYGALTEVAVKKFQAKYGLVSNGTPATTGYGLVGPKTRAKLSEVFSGTSVPATSTSSSGSSSSSSASGVSAVFTKALGANDTNSDVKKLQQLLNSDPATRVAASGVGSPGQETNFYGALTEAAVKKFQTKYGIVSSGTPSTTGYGLVGPKTRSKLNEIFGQ
ncbi:MAG: peptidoglycan-binding protein [Parcubacteria group bacterium]|nr:peptidoglycan-binding protein [Parcubacteria group bacterium]